MQGSLPSSQDRRAESAAPVTRKWAAPAPGAQYHANSRTPVTTNDPHEYIASLERQLETLSLELQDEMTARQRAEHVSRMKDEFIAMLSHELRTPMTAVVGWMKMIRSGKLEPAQVRRGLDVIHRNVQTQMRLISDLLDMSAVVTGKLQIFAEPFELTTFLAALADAHRPIAEAHCLRFAFNLETREGVTINGDRDRLHQVVANLITNAIKFTPEGGAITLAMRIDGPIAEVSVSDTGAGISRNFVPHLFERFRQAGTTAARIHGGMGLGLAVARHIIELHGGTISADSAGEGKGSTFTVRLPRI